MFDRVTGLLLLFPSCLLHIVEVSSLPFPTKPPLSVVQQVCLCPAVVQRRPAVCPEEHATPGRKVTQNPSRLTGGIRCYNVTLSAF